MIENTSVLFVCLFVLMIPVLSSNRAAVRDASSSKRVKCKKPRAYAAGGTSSSETII